MTDWSRVWAESFNSKLVRLEVNIPMDTAEQEACFNSKLVRLEENVKGITTVWIKQFQFQTGAIRSRYAHMCSNGTCARFNSKLVRLEVTNHQQPHVSQTKVFNSKLVRLEVQQCILMF